MTRCDRAHELSPSGATCKAGAPAEYIHAVRLCGGYGQRQTGTAIYYYCADCHDGSGIHADTGMARLAACRKVRG